MRQSLFLVVTVFWLANGATAAAAPPTLDRLFPASLQRGQTATIAAEGKFDEWPVRVWSESGGLSVETTEEKGQLRVRPHDDLACGVHWIRLYDSTGASALRPLVVGTTAVQVEAEPNEMLANAQSLDAPVVLGGRLEKAGDVDTYVVEVDADQQLVVSLGANRLCGSPMDGVLQIVSSEGFVVEQNDDARGIDPLIVFTPPASGKYFIRVFGFPETPNQQIRFGGGSSFVYSLTVTTAGFMDHCLPLAIARQRPGDLRPFGWNIPTEVAQLRTSQVAGKPSVYAFHPQLESSLLLPQVDCPVVVVARECDSERPQSFSVPAVLSGRVECAGDADVFEFTANKDQMLSFRVEAEVLGALLDPHLTLLDSDNKVLATADDLGRQQRDCLLKHKLPADGVFRLRLRDTFHHGGFRYFYRLSVQEVRPDFRLSVSADTVVVERDKPAEVKVTVDRQDGFKLPIEIDAVELPDCVQVSRVVSEPEGDSSKSVQLKLTASEGDYSGVFRIRGKSAGEEPLERYASWEIARPYRHVEQLWLTVRGE